MRLSPVLLYYHQKLRGEIAWHKSHWSGVAVLEVVELLLVVLARPWLF
jgi:hypothetical protein